MGKNSQEKTDVAAKVLEAAKSKNGKIVIGAVVVLIIVLNTMWNMMESKITSAVQPLTAQVTAMSERVDESLKFAAAADFETLRADFETLKNTIQAEADTVQKAGEAFNERLSAVVKAEEAKLEILAKALEDQKTYVEELKSLLAGETKN